MSYPSPKPKRRYKRYSSEFKREALLRASEEGMTDKAVSDELGISTGPAFLLRQDIIRPLPNSVSAQCFTNSSDTD